MSEVVSATARTKEKQTNILHVATEMFLQHGYNAVSLDDIISRVGGSKTTLYSYYGGKEGLFAAIVKQMCRDKLAAVRELEVAHLEPKAGLNAIGQRFLTAISAPGVQEFYRMMVAEAERFPGLVASFYASGPEAMQRLVQQNLEKWQRKGMLRRGNAAVLSVQYIGIMLGNFSAKSLLGLGHALSEKEIHDWVSRGVDLFLEGALTKKDAF